MTECIIKKDDIVEHKVTGQTWKVTAVADGKFKVKGNGTTLILLANEVRKAPDRPERMVSNVAKR
jgi:hypothetical protein